jgi:hypothetical protein
MSSVVALNELGDLGCQAFERMSRGGGGEAPERKARGRSPRVWVERAKPPSVGEAPECRARGRSTRAWVERAKPPSVGEAPKRGSRGRNPRKWVKPPSVGREDKTPESG